MSASITSQGTSGPRTGPPRRKYRPQRRRGSFLSAYSAPLVITVGLLLLTAGGLAYALYGSLLAPLASALLVIGVSLFLQPSWGFRAPSNTRLLAPLAVSIVVTIFLDVWPLQLALALIAARLLLLLGGTPIILLNPHPFGLQVLLFAVPVGGGAFVGGEIDNACAGVPVLLPCLLFLLVRGSDPPPPPARVPIAVLATLLIVVGNVARLAAELWLPSAGLASWDLVHYPMAFVLGIAGLIVIALAGHRWTLPQTPSRTASSTMPEGGSSA